MNTELERRKQEITRTQGRRKLWQRIVSALAAVVMFVTTYVLILPVEAQNRTFCEMEAHEHSAENGCYVETKTLKCDLKHEHTDECYITLLTLICQHEEHTHNKECYADKTADVETQADWEASIKAAKLTGNWSEDILAIASTQLGYRESERNYILGENNEIKGYTRYGDWIGDKYTDWSAAFVAFCVNYTGISKDEMTYDKVPEEWVKALQNQKLYNESIEEVNPGDIVFIDENGDNKADRVGIVVENTEGKVKTVEGDLDNSVAYFEYELSAQTARADVEFSNENSNNKDFAAAKSTTGRAARAEEKPIIIGSVSLPANPNYNPPIAITDPENTTSPGDRIKETSSPENRVTPTTPPNSNKEATRAANIPTLTGLAATTKVVVLFNGNTEEFTTLVDAMTFIDTAGNNEFTVVFVADYSIVAAQLNGVVGKGAGAKKIFYTSIYNDGASEIKSTVTVPAASTGWEWKQPCEAEFYNIKLTASGVLAITPNPNSKLIMGTGIETSGTIAPCAYTNQSSFTGDVDITVLSGTWYAINPASWTNGASTARCDNVNIVIGGTAVVGKIAAGSGNARFSGGVNYNIVVKDDAKVTGNLDFDYAKAVDSDTYNYTLTVQDRAQIGGNINAPALRNASSSFTFNCDGSDGAKINGIFTSTASVAGSALSINMTDVKDIPYIDLRNGTSSGTVTFAGNCQVQNYIFLTANIDAELAANSTLQMGSNGDLSISGATTGYCGRIHFYKSLIMQAGSKLVMAGHSERNADRTINNIDVRGANAEIDIFKYGANAYPIQVSGEKLGSDKLKLGIFKAPDVDTADPLMTDILLTFSASAKARENNHAPGAVTNGNTYERDLEGVYKDGNNIIPAVNCDYDAPEVPTLTGLASTTKVAVVYGSTVEEYTTLADALNAIDQAAASGASEFTVVFTANYTMTAADHTAMFTNKKGASASKIYFTSCYNNGTADVTSAFAAGNYFIANTETDIYNLTFSGVNQIQGGGNKLTIGTGVVGNASSNIWGGLVNATLDSDTDLSVFSGTWNFIGGGSYRTTGAYTLTGNSNCYIGGATVTNYAAGGGHTAAQTGNTSLTMGGSAKVNNNAVGGGYMAAVTGNASLTIGGNAKSGYGYAGAYNSNLYGNTSLLATDDAEVAVVYGGSYGNTYGDEMNLTINGRAKITSRAFASSYAGNTMAKMTVDISGQANVADLFSAFKQTVQTGSQIIYNIDGSDGAHVNNIRTYPESEGTVAAGVDINITVKNMKDIANIDGITRTNGSGTITIIGDVQVQRCTYANPNTDLVLEENTTLQCGSNSDLSVVGTGDTYCGGLLLRKSLIMNNGSKLIMAGDSNSNTYRVINNIDVQGADCEIDILKRGTSTFPIQVSGEKKGTDKLKLGIFIHPLDTTTQIQGYGEVLLTYASEPNAIVQDYALGQNVENLCKSGASIVTCKDISDGRIDISKGRFVAGTNYDMSDPDNPVLNATQYVDNTGVIYAQDHALKPSYTIYGSNTVAYAPVSQSSTNDPRVTKIMKDGVLTPVGANEKILVTPNTTVELKFEGVVNLRNVTDYSCIRVSRSYATLTLLDNAELNINSVNSSAVCTGSTYVIGPAAIMKNGDYGDLIIQCEHSSDASHRCNESICGKLTIVRTGPGADVPNGAFHNIGLGAARGSSTGFVYNQELIDPATDGRYGQSFDYQRPIENVNFCNLYIRGGNISVAKAEHICAIGSYCSSVAFSRNIHISGGRVYAEGGRYCAAIGGSNAAPADGIYIYGGAYVYAIGGECSPAIGTGGGTSSSPPYERYIPAYSASNIVISGGDTVVIAQGGYIGSSYTPGIGPGYLAGGVWGNTENIYASPDTGYNAIIRQGQSRDIEQAAYIAGVPSPVDIDIPCGVAVNERQYFTIVYFSKITKSASVNGAAEAIGTDTDPVSVNEGDTIRYYLRTGNIVEAAGTVHGYVVDVLPAGLTFSGSGFHPQNGFSYSYDDTTKRYTVRWDDQQFTQNDSSEFWVDVTVDALPAGVMQRDFVNKAKLYFLNNLTPNAQEIELISNETYHQVIKQAPPEFDLTIEKTVVGAGTGPFSFTVTFTDASGAAVNIPQPAANSGYTVTNNVASFDLNKDGSVTITGIPVGTIATIVETSHNGYTVQYNFSDGTPSVSGDTASVTITDDLTVTCINNAGFELPHTGGGGTLILTFSGAILMATALTYGMAVRRRRERREFTY